MKLYSNQDEAEASKVKGRLTYENSRIHDIRDLRMCGLESQ